MAKPKNPRDSRRGFIRVAPKNEFAVTWEGTRFRGLDVSVYGLSFLAPSGSPAAPAMTADAVLEGIRFELDGHSISVDARIKHLQAGSGKERGGLRVGVEFMDIRPEDVWFLAGYTVKLGVSKPSRLKIDIAGILRQRSRKKKKKGGAKPKPKRKSKARSRPKAGAKAKPKPRTKLRRRRK